MGREGGEGRHGREEPSPEPSSSREVTRGFRPYHKRKATGRDVPCIWGHLLRGNIQPDFPYEVVLCEVNYS